MFTIPSDLEISIDRTRLDVDLIHDFLSRSSIFVVPEWRGRGVGKALVQAMVEHPDIVGLQVVLLRSTDARSFYPEELMGRYRGVTQPAVAGDEASPAGSIAGGTHGFRRL